MSRRSTLAFRLLFLFALLLGTASPAMGVEKFCSDPPYFGVIDGNIRPVPTQITIDRDCTFKNYQLPNPLTSTLNFQTNDNTIYLIIFDNVYYTGNMACANVDHRIWFSNSSYYGSNNACQDLFIPVETIDKQNPAGQTTAVVGVPFRYTLTLPSMNLGGGPSVNDLHHISIWDDLAATGVDLTFISIDASFKGSGAPVTLVPETDPSAPGGVWTPQNLSYKVYADPVLQGIRAGDQIVLEITVVLDNTANNYPGKEFINIAKWQFGRLIDGVFYEPLPGEWGQTEPLTIVRPDLVVTKTGPTSVINLGQWAEFHIDVLNGGPSPGDAWNVNIVDLLPPDSSNSFNGGMCDLTPEVTGVTLAGRSLNAGTDYSLSYVGCELSLSLLGAAGPIGPNEHLDIAYRTKVDADSESGAILTNVAAVTQWSSNSDNTIGRTYGCPPTDGTVGIDDCQDAHDLLVALSGYFFEKTVANPATGAIVSTALPMETLRYTLSLRSIDNTYNGVRFYDDLNASSAFVPDSLSLVSVPAGADVSQTGNGILDIRNLNVPASSTVEVTFDITLLSTLAEGFVVENQADLVEGAVTIAVSDDPNVNGQADPAVAGDEDPTRVVIALPPPPPPTKALVSPTTLEATIGQEVVYEIRVPGTASGRPLYDVVVTDTLDQNLEYLGFTQTGGPAVSDNSVAQNLSFRVDQIPAGQQAVFQVRARVRNVLGAQQGVAINNTASYTYASTPGGVTQPALTSGTVTLQVVEPHISNITKSADPTTPAAGETVRYSVTLTASGGAPSSDVFDVTITDALDLGLVYAGNPAVTASGGAGANNTIGAPVATGDGINQAQALRWSLEDGNADIDIAEGETVTISYDVRVLDGVLAQTLENRAVAQWTGIDGPSAFERDGSDGIGELNDYITAPATAAIGNLPLLYAQKTAQIYQDNFGSAGIVDPGDVLRYTIVLSNTGAVPATGVVLTDNVPVNTTYVADSLRLNGASVGPDGGVSPLIAGLSVQSSDNPGAGIVSVGGSAVITFEATVNAGVPPGTLIINQGRITSNESPQGDTDADGIPSNGNQPTVVVVGEVQLLSITKEVSVVGGGIAVAGGELEYVVRVNNIGSLPATQVVVTDDLNPPLGNQVTYVVGSGTLNDSTAGIVYSGGVLTADYVGQYDDLPPGANAVVRFRVQINSTLSAGTTITNTAVVRWDDPAQTASASVSIDVGGAPGSASLNGSIWHDANLDKIPDNGAETMMEGWSVELYRNNQLVTTALTDVNGVYRFSGLAPNQGTSDLYELRFHAAGAGPNTASMGIADSPFTNGPQRIGDITVSSGDNLQNLNLPLWPNGTVYDSMERTPVAGATVAMRNAATGAPLPGRCFDDPVQQNQVTAANGFYKFDLNFGDPSCPAGGDYLIDVTPPATGYMNMPSQVISPASDANTAAFSVPACPGSVDDAVPATPEYCEVVASAGVPPTSVPPNTAGTTYHLHLLLSNGTMPGQSQVFNNLIPIDPELFGAVAITKTSSFTNVSRGSLVPYTITVNNVYSAPLDNVSIVDHFPAGFKYKGGSARLDGNPVEPLATGRELVWDGLALQVNQKRTLRFLLVVSSGVSEGDFVNRAFVRNAATGGAVSGEATATVSVVPDPDVDCTDVIGKVFDDGDLNGVQDPGEKGLSGVRVVTARGLIASTDKDGRFHITCAAIPDEDRGSNFILKLDERSLPSGYRLTTENPRVQRATRGKMLRFRFGATIHRVVRLDLADGAFEPDTTEIRMQWASRIDQLLEELKKGPSVLRLSYLGDVETKSLVLKRLEALKKEIIERWMQAHAGYRLTIETEIFWRRGAPLAGQ